MLQWGKVLEVAMPVLNADFAIHDANGKFVAAVNVMNQRGLTADSATDIRRNMVLNNWLPASDYLLIVSQDHGYLWAKQQDLDADAHPTIEFSTVSIVAEYAPSLRSGERLRNAELDIVVRAWLTELGGNKELATPAEQQLEKAGFIRAIRNGSWL